MSNVVMKWLDDETINTEKLVVDGERMNDEDLSRAGLLQSIKYLRKSLQKLADKVKAQ